MSILYIRPPRFRTEAVTFDGANDYLTRDAGLDGAADSKQVTGCLWVRRTATGLARMIVGSPDLATSNLTFRIGKNGSNAINILANNAAAATILSVASTATLANNTWTNVLFSFDLSDEGKQHLYLNDTSSLSVTTFTDDTMDLTLADWSVGARCDGSDKWTGDFDTIALWFGQYVNLSLESNRRLFIDAQGKPKDLGATGTNPGLGIPIVYLRGTITDYATNKGSGGGFTTHGALADATTSPST